MSQINGKFLKAGSLGDTKLNNNQTLKGRNAADSADVDIVMVNASNDIDFGNKKIRNVMDPATAQDVATKNYVDTNIPPAGANVGLSNLVSTAVNADIIPGANNTRSLGSSSLAWLKAWVNNISSQGTTGLNVRSPDDSSGLGSGYIGVQSGATTSGGASGTVQVYSGSSDAGSGQANLGSGNCSGTSGSSGVAAITSGALSNASNASNSGVVTIESGGTAGSGNSGNVTIKTGGSTSGDSGDIQLSVGTAGATRGTVQVKPELRMMGSTSGYVGIKSVAAPTSYTVVMPSAQGGASTLLQNDGSGNLSWASPAAGLASKKESFTLSSGDITNQYVDFAFLAETDSVNANVSGVMGAEGADYTLSVPGSVTRLTFAGDWATGGASALASGDIIRVQYRK